MDVLYHYCSTATFLAIAEAHSLRLSSLSLSNDTMEGKIVKNAVARLAKRDALDKDAARHLQESIEAFETIIDGLGFCLSEDGDLLSQWRGYAGDATGVSIGLSTTYLNWLAEASLGRSESGFTLQQVAYEQDAHDLRVEPTYRKVRQFIDAGALRLPGKRHLLDTREDDEIERDDAVIRTAHTQMSLTLISLFSELFRLKTNAFREEREWRLLSYYVRSGADSCSYRAAGNRLVPYREYKLVELERKPIVEVILGPKHTTPIHVVEDFLRQHGYGVVRVRRSEASYR